MSEYIEHTVVGSQRWDALAWQYYGDATKVSVLIGANSLLAGQVILTEGTRINVPLITVASQTSVGLPPWKR